MKQRYLLILSTIFFLGTGTASADPWSGMAEITSVYPHSGGLVFNTTYTNENLSSCDNGKRFSISKSHPNYETLVSTMLSAFMSAKKINFNIDSNQQLQCQPTINRFIMVK